MGLGRLEHSDPNVNDDGENLYYKNGPRFKDFESSWDSLVANNNASILPKGAATIAWYS